MACIKCGSISVTNGLCPKCAQAKEVEEKLNRERLKNEQRKSRENSNSSGTRFHGLYCLLVGWWLAMVIACMIVPLFFKGGRRLIKKAFGIW